VARGRKPDPQRRARKTGNTPKPGHKTTKIVPQDHSNNLALCMAQELPEGLAREVFLRSIDELSDRLRDTDLEALRMMSWSIYRHQQAQAIVERDGMMVTTPFGPVVNPMLKVAREEAKLYLKIADEYALTFVARLRAGLMQLAGQSLMRDLHSGIAEAIVKQITDGK
jgi:phage terminase small subunit